LRVHKGVSPSRGRLCARVSTEVVAEIVAVEEGGKARGEGMKGKEGKKGRKEGRKKRTPSRGYIDSTVRSIARTIR
jgi:hypothetical protein